MSQRIETRLYVEETLAAGARVALRAPQAHHLRSVLRLSPGALVVLFNGRDGAWTARLESLAKAGAEVTVEAQIAAQRAAPDVWLCFAPLKRVRLDFLVEKATELGAARLQPVTTERTVVDRVNLARLRATAREAAEQCERLDLPEVAEPLRLGNLLDGWPQERRLLVCAEAGAARPLAEVLQAASCGLAGPPGPDALLTGPEGGFSARELDLLTRLPFVTAVGLGPRILRAETAGLMALSCWQALLGDARQRPEERRAVAGRPSLGPESTSAGG